MSEFALQSDGGVTSGVVAARLGVSAQSVANYREQGMPSLGNDGKAWLYDLDACVKWYAENRGGKSHGGTRAGAGRKPKKRKRTEPVNRIDTTDPTLLDDERVRAAEVRRAARERAHGEKLLEVEDLLHLSHAELVTLLALAPDESGLTKTALEHLKLIQDARAKHRAELEKLGLLVDASEVAAAVTREMAGLREKLEQLPQRVLRAVMSAGNVAADHEHDVLDALRGEIDTIVEMVAAEHGGRTEQAA